MPSRLKFLSFLVDECPISGRRFYSVNIEVANSSACFKIEHFMSMYELRKFYAWDISQWKPECPMELCLTHQQL